MVPNFQKLKVLSLSGNRLFLEPDFSPKNGFPNLERVILVNMQLTFQQLNAILPLFSKAKEMILCHNRLQDGERFQPGNHLQALEFLNLEDNGITEFAPLDAQMPLLP